MGVGVRGSYLRLNTRYLVTHLCANAQQEQYIRAIGTVTMATTASQLGHLTFLTDSSVLLFPPNKQGMPLAQQQLCPPPHLSLLTHFSFPVFPPFPSSHFLLIIKSLAQWGVYPSPSH